MNSARSTITRTTAPDQTDAVQQLTLLPDLDPAPKVSARFLLSADTRELGMRQVAEIRQLLAERKAAREAATVPFTRRPAVPARSDRAA